MITQLIILDNMAKEQHSEPYIPLISGFKIMSIEITSQPVTNKSEQQCPGYKNHSIGA